MVVEEGSSPKKRILATKTVDLMVTTIDDDLRRRQQQQQHNDPLDVESSATGTAAAQPASKGEEEDDDRVLLAAKIEKLLGVNDGGDDRRLDRHTASGGAVVCPYLDERHLVASVLLTRVADGRLFLRLWDNHSPALTGFCRRLLLPVRFQQQKSGKGKKMEEESECKSFDDDPDHCMRWTCVRLVAQLYSRLVVEMQQQLEQEKGTTVATKKGGIGGSERWQATTAAAETLGVAILGALQERAGACDAATAPAAADQQQQQQRGEVPRRPVDLAVVDVEIVAALRGWMGLRSGAAATNRDAGDAPDLDSALLAIYGRHRQLLDRGGGYDKGDCGPSRAPPSSASTTAQQMMISVLGQILDQNAAAAADGGGRLSASDGDGNNYSATSTSLWSRWEGEVIRAMETCGTILAKSRIPSFFRRAVRDWVIRISSSSRRRVPADHSAGDWARALLLCLHRYCDESDEAGDRRTTLVREMRLPESGSSGAAPPCAAATASSPSLADDVTQLLLACVVSATTDTSCKNTTECNDLRCLAWSTLTSVVDNCGCDWLLSSAPPSGSTLGRASKLCAILRLAAGELAIQLGLVIAAEESAFSFYSRQGNENGDRQILLIQACTMFTLQVLGWVVKLADDDDEEEEEDVTNPMLSSDAVIHIRRSLENALDSCAQYLGLKQLAAGERILEIDPRQPQLLNLVEDGKFQVVDSTITRLLGGLLTEFDIFERQYLQTARSANDGRMGDGDRSSENNVLLAVRVALDSRDSVAQESLLPGLLTVFASCEGDESRLALLKDYEILGEPLFSFLSSYWEQCTNLDSVKYALQIVEMLSSSDGFTSNVDAIRISVILPSIARFIKRVLQNAEVDPSSANKDAAVIALSAAVSCYATIQGDSPPGEPDATILQRAVEFCAHTSS